MQALRYPWTWFVTGLLLLALGLVVALEPAGSIPLPTLNDKLMHAGSFMAFMLWFGGVFEPRRAPLLALALTGYGVLIELLQMLTPTRQPEFLDVVADVAGVLLGWLLCTAGFARWCRTVESWFATPQL
jgi:VanZ family protein